MTVYSIVNRGYFMHPMADTTTAQVGAAVRHMLLLVTVCQHAVMLYPALDPYPIPHASKEHNLPVLINEQGL